MSLSTESHVVVWFRDKWASTSTGGRLLLSTLAVAYFITGAFLFQIAHGIWQRRQSAAGAVAAVAVGIFGLLWVLAFISASAAEGEPVAPVAAAAVESTDTTEVADAAVETTTTSSTIATTTTSEAETTTTTTTIVETETEPTEVESADGDLVLSLLATIPVTREVQGGYDRSLFVHWTDADGDGCDTRSEVLIRDANGSAQVDPSGCGVVAGDWYSPYDGTWHRDPSELHVEHVVALKEAWDSGAHSWSAERREAFANDLDEPGALIAVTGSVNLSKGDRDPSNWIPPNEDDVCRFLTAWVRVKAKWGLSMDESEYGRIKNLLEDDCAGTEVGSVLVVAPVAAPVTATTAAPTTTTTQAETTTTEESGGNGCHPSYQGECVPAGVSDVDCKGGSGDGPYYAGRVTVVGHDEYRLDHDGDGIGCNNS